MPFRVGWCCAAHAVSVYLCGSEHKTRTSAWRSLGVFKNVTGSIFVQSLAVYIAQSCCPSRALHFADVAHCLPFLTWQKELHECVQHIQDPAALREHVSSMYRANVDVDLPRSEIDANVVHEYHRHKAGKGGG